MQHVHATIIALEFSLIHKITCEFVGFKKRNKHTIHLAYKEHISVFLKLLQQNMHSLNCIELNGILITLKKGGGNYDTKILMFILFILINIMANQGLTLKKKIGSSCYDS